jgi:menaquinone-dependent protoporphyrinogen oxidase
MNVLLAPRTDDRTDAFSTRAASETPSSRIARFSSSRRSPVTSDCDFSQAGRKRIAVFYSTRDGQSERIAQRIATCLCDSGATTALHRLMQSGQPTLDAHSCAIVAVRYGRVLPEAAEFLALYTSREHAPPLALAVVNLVARDKSRRTPQTNPYLRKTLARYGLRPALATAFAGRLNYPKYGFFDRQIIRLIMAMTGGVADGYSDIDYTDWVQVDDFAAEIVALAKRSPGPEPLGRP